MIDFAQIEDQAALRHGGREALRSMVQWPLAPEQIARIADDRWLSAASKIVFQAGFNWDQMEKKWPAFEDAFGSFHLDACAALSDEQLEDKMATGKLVRHWAKMKSIPANATFFADLVREHGSMGQFFSRWDVHNYGEQLLFLQKHGNRLGGKTAAIWLRRMGVDAIIMTPSVEKALQEFGVLDKAPSSRKAWMAFQPVLDAWLDETGESLNYISQVLARSSGELYQPNITE
ncbi:MAG: 3-methyladenine DNA glycosylase [Oceanospirillaceae bacterium]|nr:3-methyladenine DNA glycosylase [Oceanospirillaceae bacterium]